MARRRSSLSTVCGMPLPLQQGRMLAAVFLFITNRFVCPLERGSVSGDSWPAIEVSFHAVLRIVSSPDVDTVCAFLRRFAVRQPKGLSLRDCCTFTRRLRPRAGAWRFFAMAPRGRA